MRAFYNNHSDFHMEKTGERLVWDYKKADTDNIKNSIESVNWKLLLNNRTVDRKVAIFNETIINIFFQFCAYQICYIQLL